MKIVIIGSAHPLRGGGISTFNERLALELQEKKHQVTIHSFSLQYPSALFPGKSQFTDEPAPQDLRIKSTINSINPINWFIVGNRIREEKPDLVIVRFWLPFMGPCLGTIIRCIKRNKQIRVLCIADNIVPHEKKPFDRFLTRYFLATIDLFVTMSKSVLDDLKTLTHRTAVYLPHPLYDNYGSPLSKEDACRELGIDPTAKTILFFGFVRKYKGLDLLIEAMSDNRVKQLGVQLVVAGEFYEDQASYREQVDRYHLADRIKIFDRFIPNLKVRSYFSVADLVVLPYRSATQSGITQTAYCFEKPVIVTNLGGLAEVVAHEKTGYVCDINPEAIASAILRFYSGPIERFVENIRAERKKYSWDTFVKVLLRHAADIQHPG